MKRLRAQKQNARQANEHSQFRGFHSRVGKTLLAVSLAAALPLSGLTAAHAAPIDGEPSIGDSLFAGIGNTGYDVTHYDVDLHYVHEATEDREAGSIVATTTVTALAEAELRSFSLDFEGLNVDSLKVNGEPAEFTRSSDKPIESFKLHITPSTPVSGEFTVEVQYSGVPVRHVDNDGSSEGWVATYDGTTALGQPVGTMAWIPSNNTPADKATFDIAVTIPTEINGAPAAAASNGELIERVASSDGSETTWVWKQQHQMATMVTMLSIGNFDVIEDSITLSDGRVIPEWSFIDTDRTAAQRATIDERRAEIEEITQVLEGLYGPYPGDSTGIVVDVNPVGYALETQDRSFFPGSVNKGTLVHEIAHQWYGNGVSPADWNSIWISEGQASFSSNFYNEHHGGNTTAATYFNMWNSRAADHASWRVPPAAMTDQTQLFGWQSYNRAAMVFEALRQVLGEETFVELMTEWPQQNNGQSRVTEEFRAFAEELSGKDLEAFFQDWVYDADKPAWPATWDLELVASPDSGEVAVGSEITYELTATNSGQVPMSGEIASIDLSDVLDDASVVGQLPDGLELTGDRLAWTVPETGDTDSATAAFTVEVNDRAFGATLDAAAEPALGGFCEECATSHTTAPVDPVTEDDLTDETRGGITVPETAEQGESIVIGVESEELEGTEIGTSLFSDPVDLGVNTVVGGEYQVQIPSDTELGMHRIAAVDSDGLLIGWDELEIVAASDDGGDGEPGDETPGDGSDDGDADGKDTGNPADLSNTGADGAALWVLGGAALLILAGALVVVAARRRRQ